MVSLATSYQQTAAVALGNLRSLGPALVPNAATSEACDALGGPDVAGLGPGRALAKAMMGCGVRWDCRRTQFTAPEHVNQCTELVAGLVESDQKMFPCVFPGFPSFSVVLDARNGFYA